MLTEQYYGATVFNSKTRLEVHFMIIESVVTLCKKSVIEITFIIISEARENMM